MSAVATRLPASLALPAADRAQAQAGSPVLRLVAFAALAGFATGHWARLVEDPPVLGLAGAVLAATGLGAALTVAGRLRLPRAAIHAVALAATLAVAAIAFVAAGLPAALLEPGRWDDLAGELDRGLAGLRTVAWPYAGEDESVKVVILLGAPLLLSVSAALAFWPLRRGASLSRGLALVLLLVLYGVTITEYDPGRPLLRGAFLLGLVAAWLWLPRLAGREAVTAVLLVLAVGALSLPLAARLNSDTALVDYGAWNWFGGKDVTFNWNHSYGPLDWPRDGTTLLNIRSARSHYWKAETLDRFDGVRWLRSGANDGTSRFAELPPALDRRWTTRVRVTVRSLRTDFAVAAGTPLLVTGAGESLGGSADGTVRRLSEPLERGDAYTVTTYAPEPSAREMRAAPAFYGSGLSQYTAVSLPRPAPTAPDRTPLAAGDVRRADPGGPVEVPLRGGFSTGTPGAQPRLAASRYGKTFRLARRLARGAPTSYDVAKRIERHLERKYTYSERPPNRRYPLESFLFEDRIGYCQQFSGAMALMLRMVGIPARVVSGFSPGSLDRDTGEYRVRDTDAHSWVEVYFTGIGWATFDPTPAAAPAERPKKESAPSAGPQEAAGSISSGQGGSPRPSSPTTSLPGRGRADGETAPSELIALGLALLGLAACAGALVARRRRRSPSLAADASLRELRRALPRLGWEVTAATTLLELERRLGGAAGPRAAAYLSKLRGGRFAGRGADPPTAAERRALRRELTAGRGLRSRLRGFLALPPAFTRP